jgi:hypothetical protein
VSFSHQATRRIVFVCRDPIGESVRSAQAIKRLDRVRLFGICECSPRPGRAGQFDGAEVFDDLVRVEDTHDAEQLIDAARRLGEKHGALDQIVTAQETLLKPVAEVREALGLRGMSVGTVCRALDKSSLKRILEQAGIKTARDRIVTNSDHAREFVGCVGFPIVLKPLNGSGGLATWCIRSAEQLDRALELMQPSSDNAVLAEAYLRGQELCLDTITIANEPRFHSICYYRPSILEALEDPKIQWTCVMPRDISGAQFHEFIEQGLMAVRALQVGNSMTHMEGFLLADGGLSFTDATLRPAGARIGPMLAFAYDIDPYLVWARVAVDGCFDGPWERKYAVGTIFLRGLGSGGVEQVRGIESVRQLVGELIVEARLPRIGASKSATYTGDGFITVRHPETQVVDDALQLIAQTLQISYSNTEVLMPAEEVFAEQWSQQIQYFNKQLNKPAWDDDSLPGF